MQPTLVTCGFSGLETVLCSIVTAFISGVVLILALTKKFATKTACDLKHETDQKLESKKEDAINKNLTKVIKSQTLQFMMLRAIVVHLKLPPEKKEEILNMRVQDSEV